MKRTNLAVLAALAVIGCGAPSVDEHQSQSSPTAPASPELLQALDHDLAIGSTGEEVRALHGYLTRYGYFPNEKLAREYPAWRPLVTTAPKIASVYDEQTAEAVRQLQGNLSLPVTGVVDEATRPLLRQMRCGVPDGIGGSDPSNKYSIDSKSGFGIPQHAGYFLDIYAPDAVSRFNQAKATWSAVTEQSFYEDGDPDFRIYYASNSDLEGALAGAGPAPWPGSGFRLMVNYEKNWYYGASDSVPANAYDFQSAILHELGHLLGLGHSSIPGAVMWPNIATQTAVRNLHVDDKVGVSYRRDAYTSPWGEALDIGVGGPNGESVWIIGTDGTIWKWDGGGGWIHESANGNATSVTVDSTGIPWVGTPGGVYFRSTADPFSGTWHYRGGGCVLDVAARGKNGDDIWIVDCNHDIYKFDGLWWDVDIQFPLHQAERIAIDHDGHPWVVRTNGVIYRKTTSDPTTGAYVDLPGVFYDVGVGPCCSPWGAWIIGAQGSLGLFNYQEAISGHPKYWRWLSKINGRPVLTQVMNIAVGPQGEPWFVDSDRRIFRSTK